MLYNTNLWVYLLTMETLQRNSNNRLFDTMLSGIQCHSVVDDLSLSYSMI